MIRKIPTIAKPTIDAGMALIEDSLCETFDEVTPEFVRKSEILEVLLVSFVEHTMHPELVDEVEEFVEARIGHGGVH